MTVDVPPYFSQRRAAVLSGVSRTTLARHIEAGTLQTNERGQVARDDLERFLQRPLTSQDWDNATIEINRAGMN